MRLVSVLVLACLAYAGSANAVVPQRYINTQYPLNFTIDSFTKVIESGRYHGNDLAQLYWERGVQFGDLHHYDKAIADYDQALRLRPGFVSALLNRAVAHARVENYDRAFADFAQALELDPGNAAAINARGALNFLLGRYQDAIDDFKRYLKLRPDDLYRMLWLYISEKSLDRNRPSTMRSHVEGVNLDLWPGAMVRLYLGEVPVDNVVKALRNNLNAWSVGNRCEAFFYLGQYYLLQGDRSQALQYFREAVKTNATGYMEYEFSLAYSLKL